MPDRPWTSALCLLALAMAPTTGRAQDGELPPGHPPVAGGAGEGEEGAGGADPHAGIGRIPGVNAESLDRVEQDETLPAGTIVARVVDGDGAPVPGARVELGILAGGARERRVGHANQQGEARWDGLATGGAQAYRVVVPNESARFPAEPVRLEGPHGWRVTLTRWPVTESTQTLLLFVMRTFLEIGEEGNRLKVTQHLELMNFGRQAISPRHGVPIPLPRGMMAFRTEQGMGDQRLVESDGKLRLEGSIPPGPTQLAYSFDMSLDGDPFVFEQAIPFRLVVAEVYAERARDLKMRADGMPDASEAELQGRAFWRTRLSRRPQSAQFRTLRVHLEDLPGPGPGRWIALGLGVLVMALGLASLLSGSERREAETAALGLEKERLLAEAARVERQRAAGKLDDELYGRLRERVLTRLAEVIRLEDLGPGSGKAARRRVPDPRS